jgi:hypothetical protein
MTERAMTERAMTERAMTEQTQNGRPAFAERPPRVMERSN